MAKGTVARTNGRLLRARMKQAQAVEMRIAGATLEEIREALKYRTRSAALYAIDAAMARAIDLEKVDDLRRRSLDRIEAAHNVIYALVLEGDLEATRVWIRLEQRRAKLEGTDAPEEVIIGGSGKPVQIDLGDALNGTADIGRELRARLVERRELRSGEVIEVEAEEETDAADVS
jgi:hypothetical protein